MWKLLETCQDTKYYRILEDVPHKTCHSNIIINLHHNPERHYNDGKGNFGYDDLADKFKIPISEIFTFRTYRHPLSVFGSNIRNILRDCFSKKLTDIQINQRIEKFIRVFISKYGKYADETEDDRYNLHRIQIDILSAKGQKYRAAHLSQLLNNINLITTENTQSFMLKWPKVNSKQRQFSDERNLVWLAAASSFPVTSPGTYNQISEKVFNHNQEHYKQLYDFCHQPMFDEYNALFGYNEMTMEGAMDTYHSWF